MNEPKDARLSQVQDEGFWRALCPDLTISDHPFAPAAEAFPIDAAQLEKAKQQIVEEGYFAIPELIPRTITQTISKAVSTLERENLPTPFAMIYDEIWRVLSRLSNVLTPILGENYRVVPDCWLWRVEGENQGWSPHRDHEVRRVCIRDDGRPLLLTVWIPFTDVTTEHSCIYVLPTNRDPRLRAKTAGHEIDRESQQNVRALPAAAGSVLGWNQYAMHWGSRGSKWATGPRISVGIYFQSDTKPFRVTTIDLNDGLSFSERLGMIGWMISKYPRYVDCSDELRQFCREVGLRHQDGRPG
ncbi:MAG: phytanoyl-CoA dioxygenase family protein [Planctomycetales bacterium]